MKRYKNILIAFITIIMVVAIAAILVIFVGIDTDDKPKDVNIVQEHDFAISPAEDVLQSTITILDKDMEDAAEEYKDLDLEADFGIN